MIDGEKPMVRVKNLTQWRRNSHGMTEAICKEKAILGVTQGIWEIIEDPIGHPIPPIKKMAEKPYLIDEIHSSVKGLISIIILVHNNLDYTQRCIQSIKNHTKDPYQLIVVDNGSDDNTFQYLIHELREKDIIIRNQDNKGFSIGNNQALKLAEGDYVLYLNNDTEIQDKSWSQLFLAAMGEADMAGPTVRRLIPDISAGAFVFIGDGTLNDAYHYIEGWCLFGKKTVFKAIGGMDEQFYPAYSEDADLSFKAIQAGYKLKQVKVPIVHFGSRTAAIVKQNIHQISETNRRKLYRKWISKSYQSILVRRRGAIGDVLMITPIIRALKEANKEANIFVETSCPQLLEGNPYIYHIAENIDPSKFDKVFDLQYEKTPGKVRIDSMAEQAEVELKSRKMEVFFPPEEIEIKEPYIAFHTGRSWVNREWPVDRFSQVAEWLIHQGYRVIQLGNSQTLPMNINGVVDYRDKPWATIANILKNAECFIGIDSACSNLAKAVDCPAFIFYGCVNPAVMLADAEEYPLTVETGTLPCFGCRDKSQATYVECTQKEPYCLLNIYPENVMEKLSKFLEKKEVANVS